MQYGSVQYGSLQYCSVKCCNVQYGSVQYSSVQYGSVQHGIFFLISGKAGFNISQCLVLETSYLRLAQI